MSSPWRTHLLLPPVHTRDGHVMETCLLHLPSVGQSGRHHAAILGLSLFAIFSQVRKFTVSTARTPRASWWGMAFPSTQAPKSTLRSSLYLEMSPWWNSWTERWTVHHSSPLTNVNFEFYMNLFEIFVSETRFDWRSCQHHRWKKQGMCITFQMWLDQTRW